MSWIIYKHTNIQTDFAYIGLTKQSATKRWQNGNGYTKSRNKFHSFYDAIQEAGGTATWITAWRHEIIEDNIITLAEANEREKYWIAYYHTWVNDPECRGYNLTPGGDSHPCSNETKHKISLARKGHIVSEETKQKISLATTGSNNPFFGKHHSTDTKNFLSTIASGRIVSGETRKKLSIANKGRQPPNKGKTASAETKLKQSKAHIGKKHIAWSTEQKNIFKAKSHKKRVLCIDTGIIYESINEASRQTGIAACNICLCLQKKQATAGKFKWEYIND